MLKELNHTETKPFLWKFFTDDAATIEDSMRTMAVFFYTMLGFITKYISAGDRLIISELIITIAGALIGCFLSGFGILHAEGIWQAYSACLEQG